MKQRATSITFRVDVSDVSDWDTWKERATSILNSPDVTHDASYASDEFNVTIPMSKRVRDFRALCDLCDVRIVNVTRNV